MSTQSQLVSAMQGMVGNIEKAYITVFDARKADDIESEDLRDATLFDNSILSGILNAASDYVSYITGVAGEQKTFNVQFNPSTLHLSGHGGGRVTKTNFCAVKNDGEVGGSNDISQGRVRITLDVTLIFDKVYPKNAFKADKLNVSASSVVTSVASSLMSVVEETDYSVQKEVEAFIGALENSRTRNMIFSWGNLSYIGWLDRVNARYTMFNPSAEPIRAEVDLSMVCADEEIKKGDMGQWKDSFENAFGDGSSSYVTAAQKISSLFNISL